MTIWATTRFLPTFSHGRLEIIFNVTKSTEGMLCLTDSTGQCQYMRSKHAEPGNKFAEGRSAAKFLKKRLEWFCILLLAKTTRFRCATVPQIL